jgi:hypothetical protein
LVDKGLLARLEAPGLPVVGTAEAQAATARVVGVVLLTFVGERTPWLTAWWLVLPVAVSVVTVVEPTSATVTLQLGRMARLPGHSLVVLVVLRVLVARAAMDRSKMVRRELLARVVLVLMGLVLAMAAVAVRGTTAAAVVLGPARRVSPVEAVAAAPD